MGLSVISICANDGFKHLFSILWLGLNTVIFCLTFRSYQTSPRYYYLREILGEGLAWSRGAACVINLNMAALLFPVSRSLVSLLRRLAGKSSMIRVRAILDHAKGFHVMCARIVMIASGVHIFGHCYNALHFSRYHNNRYPEINVACTQNDPIMLIVKSIPGVTGVLLFIILCLIISSSAYPVRTACYDVFWVVHRLYACLFIVMLIHGMTGMLKQQTNISEHQPGCTPYNSTITRGPYPQSHTVTMAPCRTQPNFAPIGASTWKWMIGPMFVYVTDHVIRMWKSLSHSTTIISAQQQRGNIVELRLNKRGFVCKPGQFVLVQCSALSTFEWHPYTVSWLSTERGQFSIHVKAAGDWSERLLDHVTSSAVVIPEKPTAQTAPSLLIDGPFGSPMEDILRYKICLCVAGGIGITPYISSLQAFRTKREVKLEQFHLIWLSRTGDIFGCFTEMLCDTLNQFQEEKREHSFDLKLYATSLPPYSQTIFDGVQTKLNEHTYFGRPVWKAIFNQLAHSFPDTKIGVFACGSKRLATDLESWCHRRYRSRTVFIFHHESF